MFCKEVRARLAVVKTTLLLSVLWQVVAVYIGELGLGLRLHLPVEADPTDPIRYRSSRLHRIGLGRGNRGSGSEGGSKGGSKSVNEGYSSAGSAISADAAIAAVHVTVGPPC